jgi:hypothetical protein
VYQPICLGKQCSTRGFGLGTEGHFSETRFAYYAKNKKISKKNSSKTRLDEKCTH